MRSYTENARADMVRAEVYRHRRAMSIRIREFVVAMPLPFSPPV